MRYLLLAVCFGWCISLFSSCKKDSHGAFNYEQAAGVWVPYEMIDETGVVHSGPFTANSLFGSYAESVQLNGDKTFIPGSWENQTFYPRPDEAGTFEYVSGNNLTFDGVWLSEWELIKFDGDDLWLKMHTQGGEAVYKFKKQF